MPLKWSEVANKDEYKSLSDNDKQQAQKDYFNAVVLPQVPKGSETEAYNDFSKYANSLDSQTKKVFTYDVPQDWQNNVNDQSFGKWLFGLPSRLKQDFQERNQASNESLQRRTNNNFLTRMRETPTTLFLAGGNALGMMGDVLGEGIKGAYNFYVPDKAQEVIKNKLIDIPAEYWKKTDIGQAAIKGVNTISNAYQNVNPDIKEAIGATGNYLMLAPVAKGMGEVGSSIGEDIAKGATEAKNIGADVKTLLTNPDNIDQRIKNYVKEKYQKGIRELVPGKKTNTLINKATDNEVRSVKNIINMKDEIPLTDVSGEEIKGAIPQTISQMAEAVTNGKRNIWEASHDMAIQAAMKDVKFNPDPILEQLKKDATNLDYIPAIRQHAANMIPEIEELRGASPITIEKRITQYNAPLKPFYNGRMEDLQARFVDSVIANNMRNILDNDITSALGKLPQSYQKLKDDYGAFKAIEPEVSQRAVVFGRQNIKSLADFSDIFNNQEALGGVLSLLSGNPIEGSTKLLRSAAGKITKSVIKRANNADNIVKDMFEKVSKLMEQQKASILPPKSNLGKELIKRSRPMQVIPGMGKKLAQDDIMMNNLAGQNIIPNPRFITMPSNSFSGSSGNIENILSQKLPNQRYGSDLPISENFSNQLLTQRNNLVDRINSKNALNQLLAEKQKEINLEQRPIPPRMPIPEYSSINPQTMGTMNTNSIINRANRNRTNSDLQGYKNKIEAEKQTALNNFKNELKQKSKEQTAKIMSFSDDRLLTEIEKEDNKIKINIQSGKYSQDQINQQLSRMEQLLREYHRRGGN